MRREQTEGVKVKDSNYTNKGNPTDLQHTYTRWIWTQINDVWDFDDIQDLYHRMYIVLGG